jgi:BlaR1 peptidase M56
MVKPVVLMPATLFTGLAVEQIEALLAHGLAHVRRHDYLVNLLQTAVETLLFYHPAVWRVGRCIRNERENCCDDLAVEICGNPATYVRALTDLEQLRGESPAFAIAATGGSLLGRVERLLRLGSPANFTPAGLLAILGIAIVCISVIGVEARGLIKRQQPAPLSRTEALTTVEPPEGVLSDTELQGEPQQGPDWLDQIEAAGFRGLAVDQLIELKIHGIDGNYIKEIRAAGFDLSPDKILELKIHGIDGEYIRKTQAAGFGTLGPDKILELKIHGVTSDFIQGVRSLGYSDINADKILELKIHGITPDYIREARNRFKDLSLDQIMELKIHNILK